MDFVIYGPLCDAYWQEVTNDWGMWGTLENATKYPFRKQAENLIKKEKLGFDAQPVNLQEIVE